MRLNAAAPSVHHATVASVRRAGLIAPVLPVAPIVRRDPDPALAQESARDKDKALRQERATLLAQLENASASGVPASRYRGLDRDQLAAMVFDGGGAFSLNERKGAQLQLEANDREFLDRASELAKVSGDERVQLDAVVALESSKSAIERALPQGEARPDIAELNRRLAAKTTELGGSPVAISLRYPNNLSSTTAPSQADSWGDSDVSRGATRVAQLYRDSTY